MTSFWSAFYSITFFFWFFKQKVTITNILYLKQMFLIDLWYLSRVTPIATVALHCK